MLDKWFWQLCVVFLLYHYRVFCRIIVSVAVFIHFRCILVVLLSSFVELTKYGGSNTASKFQPDSMATQIVFCVPQYMWLEVIQVVPDRIRESSAIILTNVWHCF